MDGSPIPVRWDADEQCFRVASPYWSNHIKRTDRFRHGKRYLISEHLERSLKSHSHYFAALNEAFNNLPHEYADEFPDVETFRKRGLIATGWRDRSDYLLANEAEARKLAADLRASDRYAVVSINGAAVVRLTAISQKQTKMGKEDFQKSKDDVLAWAWGLCGIDPETGETK